MATTTEAPEPTYLLTRDAQSDLAGIAEELTANGPRGRAESDLDRIAAAFGFLAERPDCGSLRPNLTRDPRLRFQQVARYLILFLPPDPLSEILVIVRVFHDAPNPPEIRLLRRR